MKPDLTLKPLFIYSFCFFLLSTVSAQTSFFTPATSARNSFSDKNAPSAFLLYLVDVPVMKSYLSKAPAEWETSGKKVLVNIPLPNNKNEVFEISQSSILSPQVAAHHPEIKTYTGNGQVHKGYTISMSFTSDGFNAIILGLDEGAAYIEKNNSVSVKNLYLIYFGKDATPREKSNSRGKCGSLSNFKISSILPVNGFNPAVARGSSVISTGGNFRVFRLAVAADAEFVQAKGGTQQAAFNTLVQYVNQVIAVYRRELSVSFTLVSDVNLVFTTVGTPYTNSNQTRMLDQNQTVIDSIIGTDNYDIGHVLGSELGSGGGIATSPAACIATDKAQGVSGVGDGTFAAVFDVQLISHEMGHQLGMTHTFNSSIPVCTTREPSTSVEPGSGTTIMSYGYTCNDATGNDDYETSYNPILNFHTVSYAQAVNYINTLSCFTTSAATNQPPVITSLTPVKTIPKSTPFELTGAATDPNNDALTYSWEGTNVGTKVPDPATLADRTQPPFFRSYTPVSSPVRLYPRLAAILDGTNNATGDKLPSVGITTTHRFTVRDNQNGVTTADDTVIVAGNSGPFLETTNLNGTYPSGSTQTISWDVANTTAAPVSCAAVDILLSTDGGLTFTDTLAAGTTNNGSKAVVFPNLTTATNKARIKIKGTNNIFFDISNNDFTISAAALPVDFVSIAAAKQGSNILVSWNTVSESNLKSYEVEYSADGTSFLSIGSITARNSAGPNSYTFLHLQPANAINYYRIRIISLDAAAKFSSIVSVANRTSGITGIRLSPNPSTKNFLGLQFSNVTADTYTISLYAISGQLMLQKTIRHSGGNASFNMQLNSVLAKGIYKIVVTGSHKDKYEENMIIN